MEKHASELTGTDREAPQREKPDRYDNDHGDEPTATGAAKDEYEARLERGWKHAAWRTEMAMRLRATGHSPSRPDGAF